MTSKWAHPKSDGKSIVKYSLGLRSEQEVQVSELLNEATRVFHIELGGKWSPTELDRFGGKLAEVLIKSRGITNRLFRTGDPAIIELSIRAIELLPALLTARKAYSFQKP